MKEPKTRTVWVFSSVNRRGWVSFHVTTTRREARSMALGEWGMDREVSAPVKVTVPLPEARP